MVGLATQDPYFKPEYGAELDVDYFQQRTALFFPCNEGAGGKLHDPSDDRIVVTFNGGVTWASGNPKFDGSSGVATVPDSPFLHQRTRLAVYVRFRGTVGTLAARFNAQESGSPWFMGISSGKIAFFTDVGTGGFTLTGGKSVGDGAWHSAWCLYDATISTPTKWIYVDGQFDRSTTTSVAAALADCTTALTLGHATAQAFFDGEIEAFAIFDNLPSPQQIADLYANPWGMFAPEPSQRFMARAASGGLLLRRRRAAA